MASTPVQRPSMGRIVMYVDRNDGMVAPAIITEVLTAGVRLTVFQPGMTPFPVQFVVPHDVDSSRANGTWHWPAKM